MNKKNELPEIAIRIRTARKQARLSQDALGRSIGLSDKSISAYEKGRSIPPIEKLKQIAQRTHTPLAYFTDENTIEADIAKQLREIERELSEIKRLLRKKKA